MRTALLLLLALAAATASATDVWKWVDKNGVTHYSDQPVPGATKVEVRAGNVATAPAPSSNVTSPSTAASDAAPGDAGLAYRDFEIFRPESNQSFINTGGQVNVEIRIDPNVQPAHTLSLYLDGKLVTGFPDNATSYALTEVPRGVHNLVAVVVDQYGKKLQETAPVVFNVRQESIAQPPVGPTLRPPPKPRPRPNAANKLPSSQPSYGALNGARPAMNPATNLPATKRAPKPTKP